jgi:transposase
VPACYGTWQTIYGLFRRWQRDGTWTRILTRLQARADAAGLICWDVSVDTTIARAHQHAADARKKGTSRPNHPAASAHPNQPTTTGPLAGWADHEAASSL